MHATGFGRILPSKGMVSRSLAAICLVACVALTSGDSPGAGASKTLSLPKAKILRESPYADVLRDVTSSQAQFLNSRLKPISEEALLEAKREGIRPFCITVDQSGHDYLRKMCDPNNYLVIQDAYSLPEILPKVVESLMI